MYLTVALSGRSVYKQGYSVNVPQNKMAYEVIMVYHFHMPFLLSFFRVFSHNSIRQDITLLKKPDDLFLFCQ